MKVKKVGTDKKETKQVILFIYFQDSFKDKCEAEPLANQEPLLWNHLHHNNTNYKQCCARFICMYAECVCSSPLFVLHLCPITPSLLQKGPPI